MTGPAPKACAPHAMILAAGMGTRMRPLTDDRPKPLVPVLGRALIDHLLDRLTEAGVGQCVVNLHYKAAMLEAHLRARTQAPAITLSDESGELLDTGGGVAKALPLLGSDPFLTCNSDSLWIESNGSNIGRLIEAFDPTRMDALMLLAPLVNSCGYDGKGDFRMAPDGRLDWREKHGWAPYAWTGVQLIRADAFTDVPDGPFSTRFIWNRIIAQERLFGIRLDGFWMHVGTPEGVTEAEDRLRAAGWEPSEAEPARS